MTGFDPQQNWLAQLPRIYVAGGRQIGRDAADKFRTLRNAGGVAAAAATSGGWFSEELMKTYIVGAADHHKKNPGWTLDAADHQAGMTKLLEDWKKNLVTANTGFIPELQGGRLLLGAPYDRFVKAQASIGGTSSTTVVHELQYTGDH
ncbi:hypothetical protein [Deinococcus deserti]|uniref:Uncharacterized protein n=1 Tax=Deinococcus deserti (strain DSM 17065 / CIP 109153 / LMG 22923 / VCD115) TaxID=546414 RepID=X5GY46_DEIDV|nr:hypothetical protein [Deinococcus deserti]AHX26534.1 hypothetical protein Deide_22531 [Deinococcus deserti VCD115]